MKRIQRCAAAAMAAALALAALPAIPAATVQAAYTVDQTVRLQLDQASAFNDTNGDGLGEFEGWGTSLCWWANRVGYSQALTDAAAKAFFSDEGLDMNIGRYNVGGGDAAGKAASVPVNEKAMFYDLSGWGTNPTGAGSSMQVETYSKMENILFSSSDADFGFTRGDKVGSFQMIGWINQLGDEPGSGDNLRFTVEAPEAGSYTVKLLLTLEGVNDRDVAIRVNESRDYVVDVDTVNRSIVASGYSGSSYCMLFVVSIPGVELQAGQNTIAVAGKNTEWTLDLVKMAVIRSGEEGLLSAENELAHAAHIIRSDSGVPGYATDVTRIDLALHDMAWYQEHFARADEACGYAWNYDWEADANQMNVLLAAAAASGEDFLAEAFSNSPPYFMTVSGCSSGNADPNQDNLREDSVQAFACYLADVIEHWSEEGVIDFQSVSAMNEPYTNYWGANSNKQEGCHFDQGVSQSRVLVALNAELAKKGLDIQIAGTDETSIDTQISSYNALSDEAKQVVDRIDTHTYGGSDRAGLKALAESEGKGLWMSEVDGSYTAGTNAGEMSAALGLARQMMTDVNGLGASAWILWNAIDMHADSSEYGQSWVNKGSANDFASREALEAAWQSRSSNGYWGLAAADHDTGELILSMKYYAYGQFSRYIRPGYAILGSSGEGVLSAYDPEGQKAVIVAMNSSDQDQTWQFDLSDFATMRGSITAIRTSGSMENGEKWADVTASDAIVADPAGHTFTATMKANSITTYIVEGVCLAGDTTALREAVQGASGLVKAEYTEGSYSAVETALAAANALLAAPAPQEEIDGAREALEAAVSALVSVKDLKAYCEAHGACEADGYTEESFAAYAEALGRAQAVLAKADASQAEVDGALAALVDAVAGLETRPEPVVSKEALQALYDAWAGVEQGNYTDESFAALQAALTEAAGVLADGNASQATVDEAYSRLDAAVQALAEKEEPAEPEPETPKDPLEALKEACEACVTKINNFFQNALKALAGWFR